MQIKGHLMEWGFPVFVSLLGAVLGIVHKGGKKSVRTVILSIATSMFVAFITYGLSYYFTNIEIVRVAAAGLMSYMSTNTVVVFEEIVIRAVCKKLGLTKEETDMLSEDIKNDL